MNWTKNHNTNNQNLSQVNFYFDLNCNPKDAWSGQKIKMLKRPQKNVARVTVCCVNSTKSTYIFHSEILYVILFGK